MVPASCVSLFVSGCRHHCKNCFNYEAWDFSFGQPFTEAVMDEILEALAPAYVAGLSFLGGEPFEPENQEGLLVLARRFKERFPEKNLWCYTGFSFERDLLTGSVGDPAVAGICSLSSTCWWTGNTWKRSTTLLSCSVAPPIRISSTSPPL